MPQDISTGQPNPTDFIAAHGKEAVKTKSFYDVSSRLSYYIVALRGAKNGEKALVTKYAYDGTSSRVLQSTEYFTTWNSSWDLTEDTPS